MAKILVIEDDASLGKALVIKLQSLKYEVDRAGNGQEGLALALANHHDLILLDLIMPILSGTDMLKALRQDEWGKSVPVIIMTNLSGENRIAQATDLGANEYIVKADMDINDIVKEVERYLNEPW